MDNGMTDVKGGPWFRTVEVLKTAEALRVRSV